MNVHITDRVEINSREKIVKGPHGTLLTEHTKSETVWCLVLLVWRSPQDEGLEQPKTEDKELAYALRLRNGLSAFHHFHLSK